MPEARLQRTREAYWCAECQCEHVGNRGVAEYHAAVDAWYRSLPLDLSLVRPVADTAGSPTEDSM